MRPTLILMALLAMGSITAGADPCFHYDVSGSTVNGRIVRGELQAAPGSETRDSRNFHWYVLFDAAICVEGPGGEKVEAASRAEVWPGTGVDVKKFEGKSVQMREGSCQRRFLTITRT